MTSHTNGICQCSEVGMARRVTQPASAEQRIASASSESLPAGALVSESERFRMQRLGQDLQGLGDARPGTIEERIAVAEEDPAFAHRAQPAPLGMQSERGQFRSSARKVEAAR